MKWLFSIVLLSVFSCYANIAEDKPIPRNDLPLLYAPEGDLLVGAAEKELAPQMGCQVFNGCGIPEIANEVKIPLKVKAIAISNGKMTVGLMLYDTMQLSLEFSNQLKEKIQTETGVDPRAVLASATHTHSGVFLANTADNPDYETKCITEGVACFKEAFDTMRPAEMFCTECDNEGLARSRRFLLRGNKVITNPTSEWKTLGQATKPDPQMMVLLFREKKSKKMIAVYANFAMHYVSTLATGVVSAGYFGGVEDELRVSARNKDMIVLMSNGAEGDMIPTTFITRKPFDAVNWYAKEIGDRIWKKMCYVKHKAWVERVELGTSCVYLPFTRRRPTPKQIEMSQKIIKKAAKQEPKPGSMEAWEHKNAIEMINFMRNPPKINDSCYLMAMRIGDVGIAALPGEPFVESELQIKKSSPFKDTLVVGLANGTWGYIGTDEAIDQGGYETSWLSYTVCVKGTLPYWIHTSLNKLNQLAVAGSPSELVRLQNKEQIEIKKRKQQLKKEANAKKREEAMEQKKIKTTHSKKDKSQKKKETTETDAIVEI